MKKAIFLILFIIGIIFVISSSGSMTTSKKSEIRPKARPTVSPKPLIIKASIPYWDQNRAVNSFKNNADVFSYIQLFWYYMDANGDINTYKYANEDKSLIDYAHSKNIKVIPIITNLGDYEGDDWDSDRVEEVIKNSVNRKNHIDTILKKIEEMGFDGVDIDYEQVEEKAKDNFTLFIKELSDTFHKKGKEVVVAVHPKTSDNDPKEKIGSFQDWKRISQYVDHFSIMSYGKHYDESDAGPIAPISWLEEIISYTQKLKLPSEKIFLGIPLYGYDWNLDRDTAAVSLTYGQVQNLRNREEVEENWDEESNSPYFRYEKKGEKHEVWYEDAKSVQKKVELVRNAGFAGVTFWRLGGEDGYVWEILK